jgi:hypothetical protein
MGTLAARYRCAQEAFMKTALALLLLIVVALPLAAQEYEQLMLPVSPSVVMCGYHSRYDTRLLVFNDGERALSAVCADGGCDDALAAKSGREVTGGTSGVPLPTFLYVPKAAGQSLRTALVVESRDVENPDERSFTELPIVRAGDFREGHTQFLGVQLNPDFRQTVRIYGLDGVSYGQVMMRIYALGSNELLHECLHELYPLSSDVNALGMPTRPTFGMECDMSEALEANGQNVRIDLEPLTPGLKYWAFVSVTNNKTQHFYTIMPR